jgi:hypothetical protein
MTASYVGRPRTLCADVRKPGPVSGKGHWHHYLLVERNDVKLFKPLEGAAPDGCQRSRPVSGLVAVVSRSREFGRRRSG